MAIQTQPAVLLRKRDYRETSFLLTFFTRDLGKINGILKGARGSHARSSINPLYFSINQLVYYEGKKSDLFIISHCETEEIFLNILKEWKRLSVAYYILELVDVFTEPQAGCEEIFSVLVNTFKALDNKKESLTIARLFEIKFLIALGLWPGAWSFNLTKGAISSLLCFEKENWGICSKLKLAKEVDAEIKKVTGDIISDNLDKPLKTLKMFEKDL